MVYPLPEGKRNFVFLGEAGCGKSELAVNLACRLAAGDRPVHLFDLDMTKPLFRTRDLGNALEQAGVSAGFVNSMLSVPAQMQVLDAVAAGVVRLLYVAPERLGAPEFEKLCQEHPPALVAVDEAHCISRWGQDFRPSYMGIAGFVSGLSQRPVVAAFTATATPAVRRDIEHWLRLQNP